MTDYTQTAYECSIQNSSIKIDNTEWVNEFSEGIELKKGDQVRLLGSFIQEGSDQNEIEVETDQEVNISYSPYLLGNTLDTIDKSKNGNLCDLSQIGDIPYSTDSFGIEPPMRNTTQKGIQQYYWNQNVLAQDPPIANAYPFKTESVPAFNPPGQSDFNVAAYENKPTSNPAATGETGGDIYGDYAYNPFMINGVANSMESPVYTGGGTYLTDRPNMLGDKSETWGTNIETGNFNRQVTPNTGTTQTYESFSENEIPSEMYVGNMVKKFILPVIDRFETANTNTDPTGRAAAANNGANWDANCISHRLDPLLEEHAPAGQQGMLSGIPKVGMCIATVDIAQSSGWYADDGRAFWENTWGVGGAPANFINSSARQNPPNNEGPCPFRFGGAAGNTGIPNLKSGVQSVIGTIIAVRPTLMHINGKTTKCFEIYVTNFVNPAQLVGRTKIRHTFNPTNLTEASSFNVTTGALTCTKMIHGAGMLENGYNYNPSYNNINGADNSHVNGKITDPDARHQTGTGTENFAYQAGNNSGTPTYNSYLRGPTNVTSVNVGGSGDGANEYEMGLGMSQGLSFLWNGSHTGSRKISNLTANDRRYRANSYLELNRSNAGGAGNEALLRVRHHINDIILVNRTDGTTNPNGGGFRGFNRASQSMEQGSVPVCLGAYIICPKETMIRIARGEYDANAGNNYFAQNPGFIPRIWLDYSYQTRMSNYTTRHYVGNTWDTDASRSDNDNGNRDRWTDRFPGNSTYVKELRWGVGMIGRPLNVNWRNSTINDGSTDITAAQSFDYEFTAPGYMVDWENTTDGGTQGANGTGLPIILSSETGAKGPTNNDRDLRNLPIQYCGYNTCLNSIYFQQKDTGDTRLGVDSWRALGIVNAQVNPGDKTITLDSATLIDADTNEHRTLPIFNNGLGLYNIKVLVNDAQFNPVELIGSVVAGAGTTVTITLLNQQKTNAGVAYGFGNNPSFLATIPVDSFVVISYIANGGVGAGIDATPWSSDLIMIKENIMKVKLEAGFYTEEQLAEKINDTLHYNTESYAKNLGVKDNDNNYSIPSNVGQLEKARPSQPSIMNGNFVQTYLPDINYGFTPITTTNNTALDRVASTKDLTTDLFTYESLRVPEDPAVVWIHYWPEQINALRPYNGTTVRRITDNSDQYPTELGKHLKIYSIPYISKSDQTQKEICLIRLRGGGLDSSDFNTTTFRWGNVVPKMPGFMEMLRAPDIVAWDGSDENSDPQQNPYFFAPCNVYAYRTRLTRNLFSSGGSARVFCGANNFTFSWEQGANRYSFNNLYTPIRPHEVENEGNNPTNDFGIGDAIPSAIMSARHTGKTVSMLTGIYINKINAGAFTAADWGQTPLGDFRLYDNDPNNTELIASGEAFLNKLGYTDSQINAINNSFDSVVNLFVYENDINQDGNALRVGAKMTPAINASNPAASRCLNFAPVQQFFVQVDTDDFFAEKVPSKGNDPYFFIGSDFPCNTFFGNRNGSKLPIMGICSRNFSAFNFVFDLGGSSINFMITENTTITSIRTKIMTSNLTKPQNISENSSIIYVITRYGVKNDLTPQQGVEVAEEMAAQANAPLANEFYSQPTADIRLVPPIKPNKYYFTGFGEPQYEVDSSDEEFE